MYFPAVDLPDTVHEPVSADGNVSLRGSETVLLAEDDDSFRALAGDVLRSFGYTVLEASNGLDALRVAERHGDPIQLLVTDVSCRT